MSPIISKATVIAYPSLGNHGSITITTRNCEFPILDTLDFDSDDSNYGGPRKRRRLTHLTPNEKLIRRKLKNRVAAQTARDRKKALMVELEDKVALLEEENELLKLQNFSLKRASTVLAKENETLVSQLAVKQLSTIEADSETQRSAAPDVPLQKGQVQNQLRLGTKYTVMPANFLGLLQELAEDNKCEWSQTQTSSSYPQSICEVRRPDNRIKTNHSSSSSGMAGVTTTELELLNELISIDHVYVKPQPQCLQKDEQQRSIAAVSTQRNLDDITSKQKNCCVNVSESKRSYTGKLICGPPSSDEHIIPLVTPGIRFDKINLDYTSTSLSSSLSSQLDNVTDIADDLISLLSKSDIQTSMNLFQDVDCAMHDGNTRADQAKQNSHEGSNGVPQCVNQNGLVSENEASATKLFHEIYEHFLSIKENSSLDSTTLSDSGISSDLDALSPQNLGDSLHDSMWHETFADLFPELQ